MHVLPPTFRSILLLVFAATGASFAVSARGDGSAARRRADAGNDTAGIAPNPDSGDDTSRDDVGDTGADTDATDVAGPDVDEEYGVVRCLDDSVCDGDRCIFLIPDRDGFCFPRCISTVNCPEGSVCLGLANSGGDLEQVCVPLDLCVDEDEDGWGEGPGCRGQDCDDADPLVNFGAQEVCDGRDNNCDGRVDNNPIDAGQRCETGFAGVCAQGLTACRNSALLCDPLNEPTPEICDGWDNNCNGVADTGTCPTGCVGHAWGVRGYMTCRPGGGWQRDSARNVCADGGRGMDLARIDSAAENIAVGQMAINYWGTSWGQLWIGASDRGSDRSFYWQDGTGVTFTAWASGEPNNFRGREDCADMDRNVGNLGDGVGFRWRDVGCGNTRNEFVCRWR